VELVMPEADTTMLITVDAPLSVTVTAFTESVMAVPFTVIVAPVTAVKGVTTKLPADPALTVYSNTD
jgi:hypothetical protein